MKLRCGLVLALLATGAAVDPLAAAPRATESAPAATLTSTGGVALSLRRSPDGVELVIEGTGAGPVLQQSRNGEAWRGDLRITTPGSLRLGPQRMTLPEAGLQSVSFQGSGSDYQLQVVPMPGTPLSRPVVSADGRNLIINFTAPSQPSAQTAQFNLRQPGMVPQPAYAPPLQPRAVAPPLGDMAVGTMLIKNPGWVELSGPPVSMNLKNASAKEALSLLSRLGGYGFVWLENQDGDMQTFRTSGTGAARESSLSTQKAADALPVTVAFASTPYAVAINSVLLAAGVQGRLERGIVYAGFGAAYKTFKSQVSKVYRLNQTSADSAANFLASLGALVTKVTTITNSTTTGTSQANQVAGSPLSANTQSQELPVAETYGGGGGPLRGLRGATDTRLQSITLIGDSGLVAVAESYLRQIDLRQRQVALSVRILDVTLDNDAAISNSFAFRNGNNFIVSDRGQFVGAFGNYLPPNNNSFDILAGGASSGKSEYETLDQGQQEITKPPLDPAQINPGRLFSEGALYDLVKALITSSSTKTLASPTLFLSDNPEQNLRQGSKGVGRDYANEAEVAVGAQEITSYKVIQGSNGAPNTCEPIFQTAGLVLGARVKRIDDNGFVTFNLSPSITALTGTGQQIEGCGSVKTIAVRTLDTGDVRVRDGQTLVLTGVISDQDIQVVRKWPILGDLPVVGQFFRDTLGSRKKRELVILVTPRIVEDVEGGSYGYGYRPITPDGKQMLGSGM